MKEIKEENTQEKPFEEETKPEAEEISSEEAQMVNEEEIAKMQQELEEANDMMLRLAAELDNYKKRTIKERESLVKYAAQKIIEELLPVLDNFERAIESASKSKDFDSFFKGVKMIFDQMYGILEKQGVKKIDAVGKNFDPVFHEAIMHINSDEYPENTVAQEIQKGYILYDRVIRPSVVAVSKGPAEEE